MLNIIKSDLALEDAQNIWIYSYENWGEAQATSYIHGIQQALIKLAENPKRGCFYLFCMANIIVIISKAKLLFIVLMKSNCKSFVSCTNVWMLNVTLFNNPPFQR